MGRMVLRGLWVGCLGCRKDGIGEVVILLL